MAIDSVVIGFGYRARSGKDTAVAEILAKRGLRGDIVKTGEHTYHIEGYDICRYAFADALKREVSEEADKAGGMEKLFAPNYCFPKKGYVMTLPDWVKYDPDDEKNRTLHQWWGTEYRRSDDESYWVRQVAEQIEREKPQYALLSDMRFPNEMKFAKQHGFTVRVDRPGLPPATHASETALENVEGWDYLLDNSGTLESFQEGAVALFDDVVTSFGYGHGV